MLKYMWQHVSSLKNYVGVYRLCALGVWRSVGAHLKCCLFLFCIVAVLHMQTVFWLSHANLSLIHI